MKQKQIVPATPQQMLLEKVRLDSQIHGKIYGAFDSVDKKTKYPSSYPGLTPVEIRKRLTILDLFWEKQLSNGRQLLVPNRELGESYLNIQSSNYSDNPNSNNAVSIPIHSADFRLLVLLSDSEARFQNVSGFLVPYVFDNAVEMSDSPRNEMEQHRVDLVDMLEIKPLTRLFGALDGKRLLGFLQSVSGKPKTYDNLLKRILDVLDEQMIHTIAEYSLIRTLNNYSDGISWLARELREKILGPYDELRASFYGSNQQK